MALANRLRSITATAGILTFLLAATPAAAVMNGAPDGMTHRNVGMVGALLSGNRVVPVCTGFLVSSRVVLTAAHCTEAIRELGATMAVVSFSSDLRMTLSPNRIGVPVTHPDYTGDGFDRNDFGAIRLSTAITTITPVNLPGAGALDQMRDEGTLQDLPFVGVGYGAVSRIHEGDLSTDEPGDDGAVGPWEFLADLKRNSGASSFRALTPEVLRLSSNVTLGDAGACHGDSGGPYFLGSNLAVGVVKTGDHVCRATVAALRLDTPTARSFLTSLGVTVP